MFHVSSVELNRPALLTAALKTGRFLSVPVHRTGVIRGVLCFSCNRGLGKVGDSVEVLRAMIAYLCENPQ